MTLSGADRAYIVETAHDLIAHPKRDQVLQILADRVDQGDGYADVHERELDRVVLVVARTIESALGEPA